ncbi:titin-like [Dendrobium catenatum]|nr:titin-like [Dendrobium catenatum]
MNEGDSQIIIRGGGHIAFREAVITSRVAITREVSIECFDESFPVPDSVDLDGIDAWFDEEEKILIISIPKLLTNECSRIGEEETVERPIQEERQVCKELVRGQTLEPTEEKNGESELQGLTRPLKVKQQQAPADIPHLPPMPGELIRHSPAEEQQQTGAADAENKIAALPQHPESEYSQIMQVAEQRLDQEEEDEAAREHITPKVKRPMQNEVKMTAMEDDINASEKVCFAPTGFKKPTERTEAEAPRIAEYSGSEEQNIEFNPSKKQAQEHKIPRIDKPHETPEQCPEKKQEQIIHEEQKIPTMKSMDVEHAAMELPKPREPSHFVEVQQKCKTLDVTEPENSEPPKVKGTAQQFHPEKEEEEQNQKKSRVKEPDQVQETKQQTESKKEYEDVHTEKYREIKREKPEVKTADEVLEAAELFETKKEERELQKEQDEEKLNGGPAYEKPTSAEWSETRKTEIELQGTKEDEKHILTGTDIEKRPSLETKEGSQDDYQKEEKIKQCLEKPTEKPSQQVKEEAKQQKSKEKAEKEMHQTEEEWLQEKNNHTEELPHDKPKTEKLPEPRELHQQDGKPQFEISDQVMETKHPTKSQETEDDIQKQEQKHEKAATVQTDKKSKDVGLPDKELRSLHGCKDDEAGQLKGPDIEAFRAREQLKPKELSLDLHKQKTEKPPLKVPKETRVAAEPTKTEKEEKVEPEQRQPEEQEAQEQMMPIGPKELGQKHKQDRASAPEQVLEAAQDIRSETEEEFKQYEHEGQEDKEPTVVPAFEKPKAGELPKAKEPKPWVYELYEDEDHQWIGPDREPSKTRMSIESEEKYKNLQQEEEIIKQKAEKPTEKAQKQLFQVAESTRSNAEKETKKEAEQIEEQEAHEYKKPVIQPPHEEVSAKKLSEPIKTVQAHEKVRVKELDQIHEDEVQEHEKFIVVPTYEKPKASGLIKKEELKPALRVLNEDEEDRWKIAGISTQKIKESQYLHQEQVKNKQNTEKPSVKAPRQILTVEEPTKQEEKEAKQQMEKPEEQETSEHRNSTLQPPHEKHDSKQSEETKKTDKKHKPKVRELVQVLEAVEAQPEEQEGLKQHEQEVQGHEKAIVVPACEKPQIKDEEHFQSEQIEKVYQQDDQELQKQEIPTVMPTSKKPKASECAKKEAPKPQIYELQECKNNQWMGPDIEKSPNKKSFKPGEESQLPQQEQEIMKQKAEKPTSKRLEVAIEPTQPEEEKGAESGLEQSKEKEVERGNIRRMTTYEEKIEQEFQISVEGHDHEIIAESQEPEKQEEPILNESTTLEKDSKPMLEIAFGSPYETPDIIDFRPLEELALPTPKAPKTKGAPKRQESSRKKEPEEFEKSTAGPAFKAPKIKEFTSPEEQKHDLPELKQWIHGFKEDEDRQLKDTNREAFETRESMKPKELSLNLQKLKTEKPTLKAPQDMSKAADLIKTRKEEKVETKLHQLEEYEKENEQHEQDLKKQEKAAVVPTCEKPKAAEYAGKEEPKQQICELQEDKKQLLQQEQVIMKQKAQKPTKKVQKRFEEATEPAQSEDEEEEAKQEPDQPNEQEAQGRQIRGMPTYEVEQEQEFQISAEEGHDHEIITESLEPEKQEEPIPKEPTTLEKESKPMLEHIESKEHQKPAMETPHQTPDIIDFKTPDELALTTPIAPKIKEVSRRQETFEKPATKPSFKTPKINEYRSLEEKEQKFQAQKKVDENKSPERPQRKDKVEWPREIQSEMPTYNEEMEKQIQQLADEESFEHEIILKSPKKFPKLTKPANEVQKLTLVKELEESEIPKRKLLQAEEKAAPAAQGFSTLKEPETEAALETQEPERNQQSKYQKFAKEPSYQASEITNFKGPEKQELQEREASVHKILEPGITKKKEEQQREQLDRKPKKWDKTTLFESETERYKIPIADSLEIKGIPQSHEPYEKPGESLHVEAEMPFKPPGETKAQETACSAVGAQLPGKPTVGPSEQESQTKQATDSSIPRIQQTESKQTKKHEGPLRQFMEDESKDQPEQQFKQTDEEEAQKRASPPEQELACNGATLEPPDLAARTNAVVETVMEQKLYRVEEGELQQDIKSPKSQKPPPIPSELEGGQVPEHDETTLEPPKPLPRVRETMETGSPPLPTMEKEATEPTITPSRIRGEMEPEESPLLPSSDEETMEREFPTLIQKELHPGSDLQNAEEQKTASRQMPECEESAKEQEGKTKEPPPPHRAQEEIQRPTEDDLHKIFEVPQPMKTCERKFKIHAPKELEEEQESNPPLPLDHDKKTLKEEISSDELEASCVEMDKSTKVTKLSSPRRFHCRCRSRRPAYPIPPSSLLSGSAFVVSIMVLVFHFIKREKPN